MQTQPGLNTGLNNTDRPIRKVITDRIIKRLRWVMFLAILVDGMVTLIGQPPAYWQNAAAAWEENKVFRPLLAHGWLPFASCGLLYATAATALVSILPNLPGLAALFSLIMGHFFGASTWIAYNFGYGINGAILYGCCLAVLVALALNAPPEPVSPNAPPAPAVEMRAQNPSSGTRPAVRS